jgi:hypothetical protein
LPEPAAFQISSALVVFSARVTVVTVPLTGGLALAVSEPPELTVPFMASRAQGVQTAPMAFE